MKQLIGLALLSGLVGAAPAMAAPITYSAALSGAAESPANASPGTGFVFVTIDAVAHTMAVDVSFQDLMGTTTAAHIHVINGPGDANIADTNGPVATTTPSFTFFPLGVQSGTMIDTYDMTDAGSYRAGFVTDSGNVAMAEAALFAAIADGRAYFNIHSSIFGAGEIRGFLQPVPEPASIVLLAMGGGLLARARRRGRSARR